MTTERPIAEARKELAELVNQAQFRGDVVYLTRHGKRVAAIVSVEAAERVAADPAVPADT
jgi:prevent-host-death family protein